MKFKKRLRRTHRSRDQAGTSYMVLSINPMTPVCGSVLLYLATVLTFLFFGKTGGVKNEQGVMPMRYPFSFPASVPLP